VTVLLVVARVILVLQEELRLVALLCLALRFLAHILIVDSTEVLQVRNLQDTQWVQDLLLAEELPVVVGLEDLLLVGQEVADLQVVADLQELLLVIEEAAAVLQLELLLLQLELLILLLEPLLVLLQLVLQWAPPSEL
jgi:hypothetical protein